jgi:hypothetical protein
MLKLTTPAGNITRESRLRFAFAAVAIAILVAMALVLVSFVGGPLP